MTLIDKAEALAPCPFCGGEAELWNARDNRPAWIACMGRCAVLISKEHATDAEAIDTWNRRAAIPARGVGVPTEDIDALAYRFWSIHPNDIPEAVGMPEGYKGGKRAWFYATEIRRICAVLAPTDAAQEREAAALLRNVSTRYQTVNGDRLLHESEVLAVLSAALDPALAEQVGKVKKVGYGYDLTDEDKAAISDLLTANAALRAGVEHWRGASDGHFNRAMENGAAALRERARAEAAEAREERLRGAALKAEAFLEEDECACENEKCQERRDVLEALRAALTETATSAERRPERESPLGRALAEKRKAEGCPDGIPLSTFRQIKHEAHNAALAAAANAVEDYCSDAPDLAGHGHSIGLKDCILALRLEPPKT